MAKHRPTEIETIDTDWSDILLVCRRCGDRGFGPDGKDDLSRTLKQTLRARGQRRQLAIMEVDCLGICPKRAVTIGLASRPERLLVVPQGEAGATVLDRLGVAFAPVRDVA